MAIATRLLKKMTGLSVLSLVLVFSTATFAKKTAPRAKKPLKRLLTTKNNARPSATTAKKAVAKDLSEKLKAKLLKSAEFRRRLKGLKPSRKMTSKGLASDPSQQLKVKKAVVRAAPTTRPAAPRAKKKAVHPLMPMMKIMEASLKRHWTLLRNKKQKPSVYDMRFLMQRYSAVSMRAVDGAIHSLTDNRKAPRLRTRVEIRVGSHKFDNSGRKGYDSALARSLIYTTRSLPAKADAFTIRKNYWRLTDYRYKEAMARFEKKRFQRSLKVEIKDKTDNYSKEPPVVYFVKHTPLTFAKKRWKKVAREISGMFKNNKRVINSLMTLNATRNTIITVGSDGSRIIKSKTLYAYMIYLTYLSPRKELLRNVRQVYVDKESALPSAKELKRLAQKTLDELVAQGNAKQGEHVEAPAILMPGVAGVFFHEALGHRLEAQRMLRASDGKTFLRKIGQKVIPTFLTVYDDPRLKAWRGTPLNGHYHVDDQGVRSRYTPLFTRGILKGFLMSRKPVEQFHRSNGHGRAYFGRQPVSRMGNLIIKSHREVSFKKLFQMLLKETRRQGKPFGYIIARASGGYTHTATSSYGIQSFKNQPKIVWKVDAKTGKKTLLKGLEMIGTPLTVVKNILATGNDYGVFNGYCGAESGWVPVSAVAPSLLLKTVELQRVRIVQKKDYVLPPPFGKSAGKTVKNTKAKNGSVVPSPTRVTPQKAGKK
jgi:predicted Zn-dependent protease